MKFGQPFRNIDWPFWVHTSKNTVLKCVKINFIKKIDQHKWPNDHIFDWSILLENGRGLIVIL